MPHSSNKPYPKNIEIEIDHEAIRKHIRNLKARPVIICLVAAAITGPAISICIEYVDNFAQLNLAHTEQVIRYSLSALILAIWLTVKLLDRQARKLATAVRLRVAGNFLEIAKYEIARDDVLSRQFLCNQKIHFRMVSDYAIVKLSKRLRALQMRTAGAGTINIPGVKNVENVRDMLADIDANRESRD